MRRSASIVLLSALCVTACTQTPQVPLEQKDPTEVLKETARVSQELDSARFEAKGSFAQEQANRSSSGKGTFEGLFQDGGSQVQMTVDMDVSGTDGSMPYAMEGVGEVIMGVANELYFKLSSLSLEPNDLMRQDLLEQFLGTWWLFPGTETIEPEVTPSPSLVRSQSEIVDLVKDKGMATINGRSAHRYEVLLNKDKLFDFMVQNAREQGEMLSRAELEESFEEIRGEGELWIDSETYVLHKLEWSIQASSQQEGEMSAEFTVTLSEHNQAPEIIPPEDAAYFSPFSFMGIAPPDANQGALPAFSDDDTEFLMDLLENSDFVSP